MASSIVLERFTTDMFRLLRETFEQVEGRTLHDLYYIENWSIIFDCWIILLTVFSRRARQNAV